MDLLIRAARNDHGMIEKLCAPASAGLWATRRLRLSGLVADATVTAERAQLRKVATAAGIPYLIDPVTPLLQDDQAPDHAWARLPFATAERHTAAELNHPDLQDELIERTLDYQREHGATVLIPPYLYSPKRGDAWFEVNLQMLKRSARYLEREGIGLPVAPVFAVSLLEYGPRSAWAEGIDRYLAVAATMNLRYVALSWSASAPGKEGYAKLAHLLTATRHAAVAQPVIGWRQGLYGLALAAAGAAGYETGAGQTERCHYPAFTAARRPQPPRPENDETGPRGNAYVYFHLRPQPSTSGRRSPALRPPDERVPGLHRRGDLLHGRRDQHDRRLAGARRPRPVSRAPAARADAPVPDLAPQQHRSRRRAVPGRRSPRQRRPAGGRDRPAPARGHVPRARAGRGGATGSVRGAG
jgi:hypothetical protein